MMKISLIYPIIHCEFVYSCSLDWERLSPTQDPMVRHCAQCSKEVTLCLDDEQIDAAWEQGRCIAHPMYDEHMMEKIAAYEKGEGPYPFTNVSMPMGLPKDRSRT
jgi:hypothetical protein